MPTDSEIVLGRACHGFTVPWDNQISRQHATLHFDGKRLSVCKIPSAGNPIFFRGTETQEFTLDHGDHFVIGETTFNFTVSQAMATVDVPNPIQQKTFSTQFPKQVRYRDADRRMNVLTRLPDVIASAANEEDLLTKMVNTLLARDLIVPRDGEAMAGASQDDLTFGGQSTPPAVFEGRSVSNQFCH